MEKEGKRKKMRKKISVEEEREREKKGKERERRNKENKERRREERGREIESILFCYLFSLLCFLFPSKIPPSTLALDKFLSPLKIFRRLSRNILDSSKDLSESNWRVL